MASQRQNITAIIYDKRGKILSVGKNSYVKTHPFQAECAKHAGEPHKIFLHAEVDALVKLKDWSRAHEIHVMRYNSFGEPMPARPCPVCQKAINMAGIKKIYHT